MPVIKTTIIFGLALLLAACSNIPVSQDYDKATDFSSYRIYHWHPDTRISETKTEKNDPLLNKRIHQAIDTALAARGLREAGQGEQADFIVSYQTKTEDRVVSDGTSGIFSLGFGGRGSFGAIGIASGSDISEEDETTLMIDFIDAASNQLSWRGSSTRYVDQHISPQRLTEIVNNHVNAILQQFPPAAGK